MNIEELGRKVADCQKIKLKVEVLNKELESLILTNPAHLKRKIILKDIFNTVEEINKINMEEALEDKNQDDADDEDEDGEDVFRSVEELVAELDDEIRDIEEKEKIMTDFRRIDEKLCRASNDLDAVILTNDDDVGNEKKEHLYKQLQTINEINKINFSECLQNENVQKKSNSEPVFKVKVIKGKEKRHAMLDSVKFYHFRNCDDYRVYRCSYYESEGCNASFKAYKVKKDGSEQLKMGDFKNHEKHVHADDVNAEVIEKGKEKLKEKLLKAKLVERKKDVYYEFIEEYPKMLPDEEMKIFKQHFPTFKVLRQSMWRWQKEVLPRAPLTQKDLDEKLEYFFSDKGKHLVLGDEIDENEKRIMTFGNPEDLIYFKESKRLNIDTTFKSAAQPNWASVLILQARVEDCWAPLVYTLLPAEDEDTFKKAFSQIRKAVEKQGKGFRYESEVMFDFDETLRNAYKRTIGNDYRHRCRGCSFHFGKCIMDYVNGKRMMTKYQDKENTELNDTIKAALGEKVNITITMT